MAHAQRGFQAQFLYSGNWDCPSPSVVGYVSACCLGFAVVFGLSPCSLESLIATMSMWLPNLEVIMRAHRLTQWLSVRSNKLGICLYPEDLWKGQVQSMGSPWTPSIYVKIYLHAFFWARGSLIVIRLSKRFLPPKPVEITSQQEGSSAVLLVCKAVYLSSWSWRMA